MNQDEKRIISLALHLKGFYFKEKYQRQNFNELHPILLNKTANQEIELAWSIYREHQKKNINIISFFDKEYPTLLKNIDDPPFVLFCLGNSKLLTKKKVSIVGTRSPSMLGKIGAKFISESLSRKDITIVSGMAYGIDTACHSSSYLWVGGTIGVAAHGLDYIYPRSNYYLFDMARKNNTQSILLISEYPIGVKPKRYHFPRRNRIISGLSRSLFFIEGGKKSGALITSQYALDQGREVFALGHSMLRNNEGGEKLIFEGAKNLLSYFRIKIETHSEKNKLIDKLKSRNSFYLGKDRWVCFSSTYRKEPKNLLNSLS